MEKHKLRQCPSFGKRCDICGKLNHFKDVCRSARNSVVNTIEKEAIPKQEPGIKMVNINSVNFNSNYSTIIANLKISSNMAMIMVPYEVDMGSDGNILLFNIFTKLFPNARTGSNKRCNQVEDILPHNN